MKSAVDRLVQLLLPGVAKSLDGVCRRGKLDAESVRRVVERCVLEVMELGRLSSAELRHIVELLRRDEVQEPFLINVMDAIGACIFAELRKIEGY
jgi:hypothetical protein